MFSFLSSKVAAVGFCASLLLGCATQDQEPLPAHMNAYSIEACEPAPSYAPCDDVHSQSIDCVGAEKVNCDFPRPGCDINGCCDTDMIDIDGDPSTDNNGTPNEPVDEDGTGSPNYNDDV